MASHKTNSWLPVCALIACSMALAGCIDDEPTPNLVAAPAPAPPVAAANNAPVIKGSPVTSVKANQAYVFQPTATDPDGDKVTFTIQNKPAWATFDATNGRLAGTPSSSYTGKFAGVRIAASDGNSTSELAAFDITVVATDPTGVAKLAWLPPTENVDGTPLTNLAGYVIRYGNSLDKLSQEIRITNPGITSSVVENLAPATWYFTVSAFTSTGVESAPSAAGSKTVT